MGRTLHVHVRWDRALGVLVQIVGGIRGESQTRPYSIAAGGGGEAVADVVERVLELLAGHDASIGPVAFA